jgi:hypothetical protein
LRGSREKVVEGKPFTPYEEAAAVLRDCSGFIFI